MAFEQKGEGGEVRYGYRVIARVGAWTYRPNEGGNGEGTIDAVLLDEHAAYAHKSDVSLELRTKKGAVLRWPEAEKFGTCLIVATSPLGGGPRPAPHP